MEIYGQAKQAEEVGLDQVCGVAYRKALEFLIKDYCCKKKPEEEENIKKKFLSNVIKEYVDNPNIKMLAERAAWLGNDETHYIRKWESHDIKVLIKLIDLTCSWINLEEKTRKYSESM
ncbi:MAG: hypothetical protein ACLTG7_11415 [Romboutsia sp.]